MIVVVVVVIVVVVVVVFSKKTNGEMEQLKKVTFQVLQKYCRILVRKHSGVSWLHHEG